MPASEVADGDNIWQECVDGCDPNRDEDSDGVTETTVEIMTLR